MTYLRATRVSASILTVLMLFTAADWRTHAAGTISGVVFEDFNGNGLRETTATVASAGAGTTALAVDRGMSGVTVSVYDGGGVLRGTATTDSVGAYSLAATGTGPYRVEFTNLPAGYRPSRFAAGATGNGTTVQFVPDGVTGNVNLGLLDGAHYCQNNPTVVTSCFVYGEQVSGAFNTMPVVVDFPYSAGAIGNSPTTYDQPSTHGLMVPANQVGSVFGLAYRQATNTVYAGAFMKKHSGFGSGGTGAIYAINPTTGASSLFADLNAIFGAGTAGNDPHDLLDFNRDNGNASWDAVGKISLGGLEISPDGATVYVVNLADRRIYALPTSGPLTNATVQRVSIPLNAPGATGTSGADLRPFALQWHQGQLYVGIVNSAESAGATSSDLKAYVYTLDPTTLTFSASPVFQFALNYPRGPVQTFNGTGPGAWSRWRPTFASQSPSGVGTYPQPMLAGLAFDVSGNLFIGLRDRAGDQFGYFAQDNPADNVLWEGVAGGDTLAAAITTPGNLASGWTLESNGAAGPFGPSAGAGNNQGPGGGELFFQDNYGGTHTELTGGSVVQLPGYPDVLSSAFDPGLDVRTGGFMWMRPANGTKSKGYNIYSTGFNAPPQPTFSKANGFGEFVALCQAAPIEIGNRVWIDSDGDGVQDPGETGLDGVTVQLIGPSNTVVATAITANGGQYYFSSGAGTSTGNAIYNISGLTPNTANYRVRIDTTQGPLAAYVLSPANTDATANGDSRDSDGARVGNDAEAVFATGAAGANDHTFDFGFTPASAAILSLGNLVWLDTNNNGLVDGGEAGIAGVTVRLIAANGTTVLATTTTNGSGNYQFTGLTAGSYFVEVDRGSGPIVGYLSSTDIGSSGNPDNDTDNDDNGVNVSASAVRSNAVTLSLGGEPTNDGDSDANSNLSVDFGFVRALSLGNLVWSDLNDNGVVDPGEPGLSGVTVRLIASDGVTVLATTTTDATGHYLFGGLGPGTYFVEVVPPAGSTSSTDIGSSANPNNDTDNDDNGVTVVGGAVRSGPVTLGIGTEPTNDGDGNPDSNLTVDFGFVPAGVLSLGNLVWLDTNNNGLVDGGEAGVPGVTVRLIAANGTTVLATTTTNGSGNYLFTGLAPGNYFVEVDRATGPLTGYLSSTDIASSANPNNDLNNDDNGVTLTAGAVRSGVVTLSVLGEPINDGDSDANSNLSVDFGFVRAVSLGNLVWADANDNGLVDPGEPGIGGVTVRLIASDGVTVLATTTTDASGHYLFAGLLPGTYYVEVVPPAGATSSTDIASSANPDNDTDNDDNGVTVVAGAIRSGAITLGFGTEPVNDGDTNPDSNLTVDFGFVPAPGGGLLTDVCLQQVVPATVLPGGQMVATYTATNRGPGSAIDLMIDGMLPAGVTVASTSPSAGGVCAVVSGTLECRWLGFTPANGTRQVTVTFQVSPSIPVGTPVALWFMTSSNNTDPYPACNMVDAYVFVGGGSTTADLAVTSLASGSGGVGTAVSGVVGQPMPARFTVSNPSAVAARGMYVLLLDEAGLVDITAATWSPQGWVAATNATSATWETGLIPPGGTATLDLTLVPRTATATRLQLVRVDGQPVDPNAANDQVDLVIDGLGSGGGRWVAAGNLDGAGVDEIVTGTGLGETPQVRVFSSAGAPLASFYAFDRTFRGGVRVASCDVNNDGIAELVAAQGPGGGRVRVLSMAGGVVNELVAFDAFEPSFTGGVNVACGDIDGDGRAEVVVGPDGGRAPDVKVFSVGALTASVVAQFQAYEPSFTGGVRVTAARFAGSPLVGGFNVATAPGAGRAGDIRVWNVIGGTSSLVASAPLTASTAGAQILLADIDGDASLDLLVAPDNGAPALVQVFRLSTGALMLNAGPGAGGFRSLRPAVGHFGGAPELIVGHGAGEAPGVLTLNVGGGVAVRLAFTALEQP
ncbi:MAG: SdrD B-like domain-containing protein [Vicinamibacterales bacterium]